MISCFVFFLGGGVIVKCVYGIMFIKNGFDNQSSNPGWSCLHFTWHNAICEGIGHFILISYRLEIWMNKKLLSRGVCVVD